MSKIARERRIRQLHRQARDDRAGDYDYVRHLEMIEAIIDRMANNSFLLKGWSVTLAAGLFALAANDTEPLFAAIAILPGLAFWGLDAYYLRQERLYRRLFEATRETRQATGRVEPYSLATTQFVPSVPNWFRTLWAKPVVALHGTVALAIVTVIAFLLVPTD